MTVVPFKRPEPPDEEVLLFNAEVYGRRNGDRRMLLSLPGGGTPDPHAVADELLKLAQAAHDQLQDGAMACIFILRSSRVRTVWVKDEFRTPAQLAWLRRRLAQSYWQVDERRGIRYVISSIASALGRLRNAAARLKERT